MLSGRSARLPQPPQPGQAFFVVSSPGGSTPPRVIHTRLEDAQQAAEEMARTHRG